MIQQHSWLSQWVIPITLGLAFPHSALAQIVPDATLPNPSTVTSNGSVFNIEGGTRAGTNLFHSFESFSLPTSTEAFFNNSLDVQNIISRVTGQSISNIDGLIRANGNANVFLLNPNGIIFGSNASLNIGGSFLASTATSLKFADGAEFSAANPQVSPLLTVSVPIGLQFGVNPGSIVNRSKTMTVDGMGNQTPVGLQGNSNSTLALVGGEVIFEGGNLTSPGGRLEVGAVADNAQVSLKQTGSRFALGYENVRNFRDVLLMDLAQINGSGEGGGDIQVRGNNIRLLRGSQIIADSLGSLAGGTVEITAEDLVEVSGSGPLPPDGPPDPILALFDIIAPLTSTLSTTTFGSGAGGDLIIRTRRFITRGGPEIQVQTFGDGLGGDLLLVASESVDISGAKPLVRLEPNFSQLISFTTTASGLSDDATIDLGLSSNISTVAVGAGAGGNLTIITPLLKVGSGSLINSNPFGTGAGGTINIQAGTVELSGRSPRTGLYPSGIITSSLTPGDSGSITVKVDRLIVRDGSEINAATFTSAKGGSITIDASGPVEVIGTGTARNGQRFSSLLTAGSSGAGDAGNLSITAENLTVRDGAVIRVSGTSTGAAGNLSLKANTIYIDNLASISAATAAGDRGNISLNTNNLQLRRNSDITTNASGTANGGNITINTDTLAALENSDITANAIGGRGGQVIINAQGIFGTQFRNNQTPASDITATSELGASFSGTVTITTPDVNTSAGLVELTTQVPDATDQVVVGCAAASGNSFTVTGRGGLPEDPTATVRGQTLWQDGRDFSAEPSAQRGATLPSPSLASANAPDPIVEATSWVVNAQGKVELVATVPLRNSPSSGSKSLECNAQ